MRIRVPGEHAGKASPRLHRGGNVLLKSDKVTEAGKMKREVKGEK